MSEIDEYLRIAESSSRIAETLLQDAEDQLHALVGKLENCLKLMEKIPHDESLLTKPLDTFVQDSQPVDRKELHLVSSK